jgi:hypothetical protein
MKLEQIQKLKLELIQKKLSTIGCKEKTFIIVEIMFFDAITISREICKGLGKTELFNTLKKIQTVEYQSTKAHFRKSSQREKVIKTFIITFKKALSKAITNFQLLKVPEYA